MRPQFSEETLAKVQDRIRHETRVPPDRLTVEEQVGVLVELHDEKERKLKMDPERTGSTF
jgi:hypothetical protein